MEGENLVIIHAGLNDVLKGKDQNLQRQSKDGMRKLREASGSVHVTLCTDPEVWGQSRGIERGVVGANCVIKGMSRQLKYSVMEVRSASPTLTSRRHGLDRTPPRSTPDGERLCKRRSRREALMPSRSTDHMMDTQSSEDADTQASSEHNGHPWITITKKANKRRQLQPHAVPTQQLPSTPSEPALRQSRPKKRLPRLPPLHAENYKLAIRPMRGETAEPNQSARPSDGCGRLRPRRRPHRERNDGAGPLVYGHLPTGGLSSDSRPEFGMTIAVTGTSLDEMPDGITGWVVTTQRGKKTSGSEETPLQVSAPTPGPAGGLLVDKVMMLELVRAVASAARVNSEKIQRDTVCPYVAQNIIVICTPKQARVSQYASVRALGIDGQAYEVFAYAAAPEKTVKGVIGGVPLSETPEMIRANVVNNYTDMVLEAHRSGISLAVIVLFNGNKVPAYVKYCGPLIWCRIYQHHKEACKTCGQLGHRRDVCPRPNVKLCFACRKTNPRDDHEKECKPRCKLCGRLHPTGTGNCANKFKTPFLLRKRERKTATEKAGKSAQSMIRFSRKDDSIALPKSAQREGSNSRSESRGRARCRECSANRNRQRSLPRDRAWTGVVTGAAKSEKDAKTHQRSRTPAREPQNDPLTAKMLQL
ncbi:hypothetical protein HPB51_016343 [Rhipicephalus microplus]|uniref:CCHC-type domain-containing protein n=1 Tax=Rhipicephalus microplus TaxID=6941 RepID=A0A9J6EPC4_RHIMP|nr:hypothetical protein HPB51_016343 [Rhipicephalus microplus]